MYSTYLGTSYKSFDGEGDLLDRTAEEARRFKAAHRRCMPVPLAIDAVAERVSRGERE